MPEFYLTIRTYGRYGTSFVPIATFADLKPNQEIVLVRKRSPSRPPGARRRARTRIEAEPEEVDEGQTRGDG